MKLPFRLKALAIATVAAIGIGAAASAYLPLATAVQQESQPVASAPAPTITLPDFSVLVQENADAVVHIMVEGKADAPQSGMPDLDSLPEPFRRFFQQPNPRGEEGEGPRARGQGSGFIISEDGYIVSNHHVVGNAERITVKLNDKSEYPAKLVGSDKQSDVALLKIDAQGALPAVKLGDSGGLKVGQWVFAIGAPFGLERTATQGIVSALARSLPNDTYTPFIQTDVAVNPGNSGGPLFDTAGRVVGINSQIFSRSGGYMGLSFAIPINEAMRVVEQLKTRGVVERGWLGIQFQDVNQDLARSFGLDKPRGALVALVTKGSPAEKAGFKTGDVIVAFGDKPIVDSRDLPPLVGATPPGEKRTMTVVRDGNERKLEVTLGKLESKDVKLSSSAPTGTDGGRLNVVVADLTPQQRQQLEVENGVLVSEIGPGAAASSGVRVGDVLLQLDGKAIQNAEHLRELTAKLKPGSSVPMLVKRGPSPMFLALQIPATDKRG